MKISTRLMLLFLVVAVLPLVLFSYFNLQQDEATLRTEVLARMSDLADKKAIQVKSYLTERVQDVHFLVRGPRVMGAMDILPGEYAAGRRTAARYAREDALTRQYFERYVDETGLFYDVFLITPQGEVVYSQKHEADFATNLLTGNYRDTQLAQAFRTVRMTLEPVISGYELYAPSQIPSLFIAAPIMVDGRFKGVFAVQLGNELFYRVATDATGLGLSGEVAFARRDGDGALYATPLRYRTDAAMKLRLGLQQIKTTPMFGALSGESGAGVKPDYRGKPVVAAWRYLPELDWGMVVKIDADEVFAPINRQRNIMLEALLGLLLFAGLVAYYFGRQISAPLVGLARTADEVSKGNLDRRVEESAPGELGLFARAFNRMAANLQALYRTLEDRVEERTRELNVSNEQLQEEIVERTQIESNLLAANDELERNRVLLNEAQRIAKVGNWELDMVGGHLYWSDEIFRLFEIDPAKFAATYAAFLNGIHPDDREKVNQAYTRSLETREPYEIAHRLLMVDGRIKWVNERCETIYDIQGKALRSIGTVQDITERQKTEDALQRSNTDLERFAYSVSHDMRQPLRAVSGHLQLLQRSLKDKLDEDERENLGFALEGAKRMDSMIVSLLDYSRVGRKTQAMQWLASRESLDEALGFLALLIAETKAQVRVSGEWPQVFASRDELTRLFQNQIGNAIKFRDAQQAAQVEVDSSVHGDTWRVSVRDHGIGIDPQQINRLFQFFSRLQSRARFEGTGMGLALCRRIVEHHHGRIWAESEGEGKGCVFIFELPLNQPEGGAT